MPGIGIGISPIFGSYVQTYKAKVLATASANLIAYWPLDEATGSTADNFEGTAARDGSYTGVTLNNTTGPDGVGGAPLFDGANDYVDIHSASLNTAMNKDEGTLALWFKVSAAGVWTDGSTRTAARLLADNNNFIDLRKKDTDNRFEWIYKAGGTQELIAHTNLSSTAWLHFALTWSAAADEVKAYYAGSQHGSTATGLGTWAGNLDNTGSVIGARNTTPTIVMDGWLAHVALWTTPLTSTQISELATT